MPAGQLLLSIVTKVIKNTLLRGNRPQWPDIFRRSYDTTFNKLCYHSTDASVLPSIRKIQITP